jgi:hypothetical protein
MLLVLFVAIIFGRLRKAGDRGAEAGAMEKTSGHENQ